MGWTGIELDKIPLDKKGKYNRKAFLDKEFGESKSENYTLELVQSSMVSTTWYGAIKRTNNKTNESIIFGLVVATRIDKGFFWYKDMDETMGPYYNDCPLSIIKKLSPTEDEYALEWRKRCITNKMASKYRTAFFKIAKDKEKVACIKMILPRTYNEDYKEGDIVYLYYGKYRVYKRIYRTWRDESYMHWSAQKIKPENCTLILTNGEEATVDENGELQLLTTF